MAHVTVTASESAPGAARSGLSPCPWRLYGRRTGIVLNKLTELSKLVERLSRFPVPRPNPWSATNCSAGRPAFRRAFG